jgi:uncharacterized protein
VQADFLERLKDVLTSMTDVAVAVSGGVDSLTLAFVAHRTLGERSTMYHAISPAVPNEATERTVHLARSHDWTLHIVDAGEFDDRRYRTNPVNRCYYCKTNLYGAVARHTKAQILSGTNLDDLGEYRPGLEAAREHGVRHPFVESGIGKATVRSLAAGLGLGSIADLPAAPCLSSRVETGIAIEAAVLSAIHRSEQRVRAVLNARTVRCRIRAHKVVIELDSDALSRVEPEIEADLRRDVSAIVADAGITDAVFFAPYRTGSAFLRSIT